MIATVALNTNRIDCKEYLAYDIVVGEMICNNSVRSVAPVLAGYCRFSTKFPRLVI